MPISPRAASGWPGGLDVGGLAPMRYGISLAVAADLPQAKIGRCDTHTVRC